MKIEIVTTTPPTVRLTLRGYDRPRETPCTDLDQARTYAHGLADGARAMLSEIEPPHAYSYVEPIGAQQVQPKQCGTCADSIETRAAPCDECGHNDEDDSPTTDLRLPLDYDPVRDGTASFSFGDDSSFPCHPHGTYWNGFDNVSVSAAVLALIVEDIRASDGDGQESAQTITDLSEIEPDADGLISLSHGYATQLDPDPITPPPAAQTGKAAQ